MFHFDLKIHYIENNVKNIFIEIGDCDCKKLNGFIWKCRYTFCHFSFPPEKKLMSFSSAG